MSAAAIMANGSEEMRNLAPLIHLVAMGVALGLGVLPGGTGVLAAGEEDAVVAVRRQAEAAQAIGRPVELRVPLADGVEISFRLIPPGVFPQGRRTTRITQPFYIGTHEVTQAQWQAVMGDNPSYFKDHDDSPRRPVERVSWNDITGRFLPAMQNHALPGTRFRLPSEAEWEHACRAGTRTPWAFGDRITPELANIADAGLRQTVCVGSYPANAWGLHDMHGNVSEWCSDWFDADYYARRAPEQDPVNLTMPKYGRRRVMRGGSWANESYNTRSVERHLEHLPDYRNLTAGFRLVLDLTEAAAPGQDRAPARKEGETDAN